MKPFFERVENLRLRWRIRRVCSLALAAGERAFLNCARGFGGSSLSCGIAGVASGRRVRHLSIGSIPVRRTP